jgi:hypothetical protein
MLPLNPFALVVRVCLAVLVVALTGLVPHPASAGMAPSKPHFPQRFQPGIVIQPQIEFGQQCSPPMVMTAGGCRCPRGTINMEGTCIARQKQPNPEVAHCGPGEVYSSKREACVCRKGLQRIDGVCVPQRQPLPELAQCQPGEVFSTSRGACVCRKGLQRIDGVCVPQRQPLPELAQCGPNEVFSQGSEACVCRKGFQRIGGECRKPTQVTECGPNAFFSKSRQACRCRKGFIEAAGECVQPGREPPKVLVEEIPQPQPKPQRTIASTACLPPDLWDMMRDAYGREPDVPRCDGACLPKPVRLSDAELAELEKKNGIKWCNDCVDVAGYLPLSQIRRIEEAGGITLCLKDGARMCSAPGYTVVEPRITQVLVRQVIRQYPLTLDKEGDIAVVIGNETYGSGIVAHANASSDADAVMTLLTEQLGYLKDNIIDLRNATLADLRAVFGGEEKGSGRLEALYGARDRGNIFVYVSSHGMADPASSKPYLLPVDANTADLAASAYALEELYDRLARIGAGTILVALEASFGREPQAYVDPPNLPEAEVAILPERPVPGLAVMTASDRDQHALNDPEFGLNLFTRYLIEGLAGKADDQPVGNGDKRLDTVELYVYVADAVRTAARKTLGLEQKPQLARSDNLLIGRLAQR